MSIWGLVAFAGGLAAILIAARQGARSLPHSRDLPESALQRSARWSLVLTLPILAGLVVLLLVVGPESVLEGAVTRILFFLLVVAALVVTTGVLLSLTRRARSRPGLLDELDRAILDRAPATQSLGVLVTLTLWTMGIVERFFTAGVVPIAWVMLLFWSCVLVYAIGLPAGVLVGYRSQ